MQPTTPMTRSGFRLRSDANSATMERALRSARSRTLQVLSNMEGVEGISDKLRPVISDLKLTIGTEIEKYRRGDYI